MGWNGSDLRDEYATALLDTSASFKTKVLGWMNDVLDDICSRYQWPFLKARGIRRLTVGQEEVGMYLPTPTSAVLASVSGGALTDGSTYKIVVTFYRSSDQLESIAGGVSNSVTTNSPNLQLNISSLPVSSEPSVTARRIYLSKDNAAYYLATTVSDNTSTTASVTADATSLQEPPPHIGIRMFNGRPWLPSQGKSLEHMDEDQIRLMFPSTLNSGSPFYFSETQYGTFLFDKTISGTLDLYFNYIRIPRRFVADQTTTPDLPIFFKQMLSYGVLHKGYEFRERDLALQYKQLYEAEIHNKISESSRAQLGWKRIRDVVGDSDGRIN